MQLRVPRILCSPGQGCEPGIRSTHEDELDDGVGRVLISSLRSTRPCARGHHRRRPDNNLFTLTLSKAARAYGLAEISVNAGLPGQTATVVNFTLNDTNGNGKLDQGENLNCKEPPVNLFDSTSVGKAVSVSFTNQEDGTFFQIGSGTWTPAN